MQQLKKLNGSAVANEDAETQTEVEAAADDVNSTEVAEQETDPVAERLAKLEAQMAEQSKALEQERAKAKDLGARLTRSQQVQAEMERFHATTLPEINKKFEERWADNPAEAVREEVTRVAKPVTDSNARTNAELWKTQVMVANPALAKYESRVIELSLEDQGLAALTYTKKGIEKLFSMARAEDLEKEIEELKTKSNGQAPQVNKDRTFTESSAPRNLNSAPARAKLTPAQMEVARKLRITPENYSKRINQVHNIGEMEDN